MMNNTKELGTIILPFPTVLSTDIRDTVYPYIIELKDQEIKLLKEQLMEAKRKEKLPVLRHLWENYITNKHYWAGLLMVGIPVNVFTKGTIFFLMSETGYNVAAFWKSVIKNYRLFHSWLTK